MSNPNRKIYERRPKHVCRITQVHQKEQVSLLPDTRGDEQQRDCGKQVINRKDSQRSASIEFAVIATVVLRIEQNSGNQKARQHKKQIDATPANTAHGCDPSDCCRGAMNPPGPVVMEKHGKDRQATQPVECWYVLAGSGVQSNDNSFDRSNCCHSCSRRRCESN